MKYLRLSTIWLASILLSSGLSLLLSSWVFNATLANRSVVKSWIISSEIYTGFVDEVVSESAQNVVETGHTVDDKLLLSAANQAFTPQLLQASTESILDGAYDWLDGTNESVEFTLDLTEAKTNYADALAVEAENKLDSLPDCSPAQLAAITSIDVFSLTCTPPAYIYQPAIEQVQKEVITSEDFLPDPVVKAADVKLPIGGDDKSIEDTFPYAPAIYQLFKAGVIIALSMIALAIGILLLIAHDKLAVLHKVAKALLIASITAGIMTGVLYYLQQSIGASGSEVTTFAERITEPLIKVVAGDVLTISLVFTVVYLFLSLVCYSIYRVFLKRRQQQLPGA